MVSSIATLNFIINNVGSICFYLINLYSRLELLLKHQRTLHHEVETIENKTDMLDCLIGNNIIHCNASESAVEKINGSEFTVLLSGKNMVCFYPPIEKYYSFHEVSNVRFISVKVEINTVEYDIKMSSPTHSFYVVGNDLNVDWVRYYFLKFNHIELPEDIEYQMTVIDDDVNFVHVNQSECISLERDEYEVYCYEVTTTCLSNKDSFMEMLKIVADMKFKNEEDEEQNNDESEEEEEQDVPLCILEEEERIAHSIAEYEMEQEDALLDKAIAEYETTF